jgi:hypothetical protein
VVEIERCGKVEFICKTGELRAFDRVYFIPKLTANIMSVGRLNQNGYNVLMGCGKLAIRAPGWKLLTMVKITASWLYLLTMRLSSVECLVARSDEAA